MHKLYILGLAFISNLLFSQSGEKKFIMNLLEDKVLTIQDKSQTKKYYDSEFIDIKFDTVKTSSIYLDESFKIYKFNLEKNSVEYDRDKLVVLFNSSYCDTYILAVDSENISYKLSGFSKNDLLYFINSMKKIFHNKNSKYIINFLKENVSEIDFDCIYNSIKNEKFEEKCIKPCSDGIRSH